MNSGPEPEPDINETVDRLLQLVLRRRWWAILAASGVALATVAVVLHLPNRYRSEATLLVQRQVPESYVAASPVSDPGEDLVAKAEEMLSGDRLLGIIQESGLYAELSDTLSPEERCELMRQDISISPIQATQQPRRGRAAQSVNGFKISFVAQTPELAQAVTSRLASLFVEENLKSRAHRATVTKQFLNDQVESARRKVAEQEERLRTFKLQHTGQLPEQQQGNIQLLAGFQAQIQANAAEKSRARALRDQLQAQLDGHIARLQSERTALLNRFTAQHPRVLEIQQNIARLEQLGGRASKAGHALAESGTVPPAGEDPAIDQLRRQFEANALELENLTKAEKQLRASAAEYQARLNLAPVREQELAGILRDYDLSKQEYSSLLGKEMQSQVAADLEEQQHGDVFRIVDRPKRPRKPESPQRLKLGAAGVAAGLAFGVALAFVVDIRDRSFHSEKEMSKKFGLPLVVGVPVMATPAEERARSLKRAVEWFAVAALTLIVAAAELYLYSHG